MKTYIMTRHDDRLIDFSKDYFKTPRDSSYCVFTDKWVRNAIYNQILVQYGVQYNIFEYDSLDPNCFVHRTLRYAKEDLLRATEQLNVDNIFDVIRRELNLWNYDMDSPRAIFNATRIKAYIKEFVDDFYDEILNRDKDEYMAKKHKLLTQFGGPDKIRNLA